MCGDCQRRADINPLRVLDCKVPGDQEIIESLPKITEFLCDPCRQHYARVQQYLAARDIPFTPTPRMVRGLDYYTRTTFEFVHESLGAQNSVLGGGRYDGLAETIGGQRSPGIGFSIGEDRMLYLLLAESDVARNEPHLDLFVAWLGEASFSTAWRIARYCRRGCEKKHTVELPPESRKLARALELASKMHARYAVIVGENEVATQRFQLKDLSAGHQRELSLEEIGKELDKEW